MHVLVATHELQGLLAGDYCHAVDGELVTPLVAVECAESERCGCGRGFPGLASSRATTTAMVVDLPHLTEEDLRDVLHGWLEREGWSDLFARSLAERPDPVFGDDVEAMLAEIVDEHVEAIVEVCRAAAVGSVVHRSGRLVTVRGLADAA